MPQVSQSPAAPAALSQLQRGQVQYRATAQREEQRTRVLERVDQLVRGMEAVAQRLSSDNVSTAQRSLLVSRFNDLQRRVNEIDGIIGGEGRADAVAPTGSALALDVSDRGGADRAVRQLGQMRQSAQSERESNRVSSPGSSGERGTRVDITV